ncbi:MFS transporter [Micromonospora sp. NPDC005206]|uniref:MFS transporter n=1 Tax=Micromonospora sp. NPDC005206 TaxID=3157022 RepID=UPI0033A590BE
MLTAVSVLVVAVSGDLVVLALGNVLLGFGQILTTVSGQGLVPILSKPHELDRRFAGWTLSVSIGQSVGLPLAGLVAAASSDERSVATTPALLTMIAGAVPAAPFAFVLSERSSPAGTSARDVQQSVFRMLAIPGMRPALFSSLVVLTSMDLLSAYLPVLGEQFGFSVILVSLLLTVRTTASVVSRAVLPRLLKSLPRPWLLVSATLCSALPMAAVPLLREPMAMALLLAIAGFFWGIGQPLTMTWVVGLVSQPNRASALSLRLTGNRLGQVLVPLGAGVVAGAAGAASVFVVTGALLWTSAGITWRAIREGAE